LVPFNPSRQPNQTFKDNEVTLYVKGFLSKGVKHSDFKEWDQAHRRMLRSEEHSWGPKALGYSWTTSGHNYFPRVFFPVPLMSVGLWAYRAKKSMARLSPAALASSLATDAILNGLRMMFQYRYTERTVVEDAARLSEVLLDLRNEHETLRVVAHSLGCRKVVQAVALLPPEMRPDEVHLCAPACVEDEIKASLSGGITREGGSTHIYHTRSDLALEVGFRLARVGYKAVGAIGLENSSRYPGLVAHEEFQS